MMKNEWNLIENSKVLFFFAYYIGANFVLLLLPLVAYGAYRGSIPCLIAVVIAFIDMVIPLQSGPRGQWLEFCLWTDIRAGLESMFNARVIVEGKYERNKNYCVAYFPHSLFAIGINLIANSLYSMYGSIMLFTAADIIFVLPILRRFMTWWGCTGVSEKILKTNMKLPFPNNIIMLQPDGIAGMFYGLESEQIVLNKRRGFCRVALQTGTSLVPCYCFGGNQLYNRRFGTSSLAARLSSKIKISLVFWTDRFGIPFGIFPNRTKLLVVLGEPIDVKQIENPTKEDIDALHSKFVVAIKELFDRHKDKMGKEWCIKHPKLYLENEQPDSFKQD